MGKLRFEDVGGTTATEYVNEAKLQAICDEGFRLIQIIGDHDLHIRFGTPVKGIFEKVVDIVAPKPVAPPKPPVEKPPVVKTAPPNERIPTKRQSFADKVRAQQEADAKGEKKE